MINLTRILTYLCYKVEQILFFLARSEWQCVFIGECFDVLSYVLSYLNNGI